MAHSQPRVVPSVPPLNFSDYKLTPDDVSGMTAHLRALPFLQTIPEARVRAAAIALITFGGSSDGKHHLRHGALHSTRHDAVGTFMPSNMLDGLKDEYMRMIMDLVRCLPICWSSPISTFT